MGVFIDSLFSQPTEMNVESLVPKEKSFEIRTCDYISTDNLQNLINDGYLLKVTVSLHFLTNRKYKKNQRLIIDRLIDYSEFIDIFNIVYEKVYGVVPLNRTYAEYTIFLNPIKNIKQLLNLFLTLNRFKNATSCIIIHTISKNSIYPFDSEIVPNGELLTYLYEIKYGTMPIVYKKHPEKYEESVRIMTAVVEAGVNTMLDAFDYDTEYVRRELHKWLRTSKQHWSVCQIEDKKLDFKAYEDNASSYFESMSDKLKFNL